MTKKNVIEMVTANKARINETSKHYEMSQNDFETMLENLPDELKIVKSKNQENKLYKIQRAEIEIKSVSTKVPEKAQLDDCVGYIRLSSFISKNACRHMIFR